LFWDRTEHTNTRIVMRVFTFS